MDESGLAGFSCINTTDFTFAFPNPEEPRGFSVLKAQLADQHVTFQLKVLEKGVAFRKNPEAEQPYFPPSRYVLVVGIMVWHVSCLEAGRTSAARRSLRTNKESKEGDGYRTGCMQTISWEAGSTWDQSEIESVYTF
ncbi:hypothetical protein ElyMa_005695000 [Elysia marginata]|uniref:Uncharacterized protein n=1 Tax=Elysia marginata TaxID=1093978 RepID=A0AAV4FFE3_9GAST|nr:hypothetical protein ElyMa_005695000 [Elysia marginata]